MMRIMPTDRAPNSLPGTAPAVIPAGAPSAHRIERGTCYCLFAYDIGATTELEEAARLMTAPAHREAMPHRRAAPAYFEFHPLPLRLTQQSEKIALGSYATDGVVDCVLYDFGAVEVIYAIDIAGPVSNLGALSSALYGNTALQADSRRRVDELITRLGEAVTKANIASMVEDYVIYHLESLAPAATPADFVESHRMQLAQILRSETDALSEQEMADALLCQISYSPEDLAVIDWQATLLIGRDVDDVRAVLEFANVELLEMRFLDDQLDRVLDTFYKALSRGRWRPSLSFHAGAGDMRRLARLQMESAVLFEEVNNALKLLGDQFLARVYRLASNRLHIPDWDGSIIRKLQTVESLYSKLVDFQNTRRMELLEWIIILLIAISIIIAFVPGLH
jgi:hypothetical protein